MAKAPKSKKSPAKSPTEDTDFILHSLQDTLEKDKRYQASDEQLQHFYKQMLLIRRFEERAGQLYGLGLIGGFCHLYIGQEAVAVGLQSALTEGLDSVITGYRALLDPKSVNKSIHAFVHVTLRVHGAEHIKAFDDAVASFDEIQGAWHTTGEEDFILRVLVTDMDQYERFVVHRLSAIPNIGRVRTSFILSPVKDQTTVPLDAIGGGSIDVA